MRTLFVGILFLLLVTVVTVSVLTFSYVDIFSPGTLRVLTKSAMVVAALIALVLVFKFFLIPAQTRHESFSALFGFFRRIDGWPALNVMFVALTAAAALAGLETYRQTNTIATIGEFESRDREIRNIYMTDKEARFQLMQVFADVPSNIADAEYERCSAATRAKIKTWATDYVADAIFVGQDKRPTAAEFHWNTIADLEDQFWSTEQMRDPRFALARALVMHASDYLYIVHDAMRAKQSGYFTESEYHVWGAYLDDLGPSPFFLEALRDETKYGYMMKSVAGEFRDFYRTHADMRCIVKTLYPEFLKGE